MNAKKTKKNAKPKKHRVSVIDRIIELENRMAVVEGTIAGLNPAVPTPTAVESPEPVVVP